MQFGILGPLEVTTAAGAPVPVGGPRPRALLVLLALDAGRVVGVDRLVDGQYGDEPPSGAANALQAQVSRVRRALGDGVVEFHPGGYRLAAEPDDVDAHRFERLAAEGHRRLGAGQPADATPLLREALALWRGEPLADLPFGEAPAARLRELRVAATEDLMEAELALPDDPPVAELGRLVAAHPLRERLRGQLMRALHASGRQAEALAEFDKARRLLRVELGMDPSAELAAVHRSILRADRAVPPARRGLPEPFTTFVGRSAELTRLDGLDARLVTVLGPGGTGKTRLATEWAARSRHRACFVDLAPVTDAAQVPVAMLGALGVRDAGFGPAADPVEHLVAAVRGEDLLLVVDNCEHVFGGAGAVIRAVLAGAPAVRVLATSREPLGITGETLLPLGPLPVADGTAVALFADRAGAVRPGFTVDDGNAADVVAICTALDGLPLAIELAAARLRQFPVDAVAGRLLGPDRFQLLSRGDPTATARHRSLAAVVEWSWDLLGATERSLAMRFTVFTGGARIEAVEAVCGDGTADVLGDLVDRSIVETDGHRYRMLDTIRLFCAERLAGSGAEPEVRLAHARYHLALAQEADPHLRRVEQLDWLARLGAEHANLGAALRWSVEHARPVAFELVAALSAYWWLSGHGTEGGEAAARLLAGEIPSDLDEAYVCCVMHAAPRAAPEHWERAGTILRTIDHTLRYPFVAAMWGMTAGPPDGDAEEYARMLGDDPWNEALMHLSRVLLGMLGGGAAEGEQEMVAVLTTFRALGDRWGCAQALDWLGVVDGWRGRWGSAYARWDEAITMQRELGALDECGYLLCHRGEALLRHGDVPAAEADFAEAEELLRRAGQLVPIAEARLGLAEVAARGGRAADAAALLAEVVPDGPENEGHTSWHAARVFAALGRLAVDPATARRRYREALAAGRASPLRSDLADAVEVAAGGLLADGAATAAAELLGIAVTMRGLAVTGDRYVAATADSARAALGAAGFAEAYARGLALAAAEATMRVDVLLERWTDLP